jgi:putative acetyltransferase
MPALAIVDERPGDLDSIRSLHIEAFDQTTEADLVDALRRGCDELLSLVALLGGEVVGHILFSPAIIESERSIVRGFGLAPMAVRPVHQRRGIGSALVQEGLDRMKRQGCPYVIVLGHPGYYPRFGFQVASSLGIRCPWEVPDEAFMILAINRRVMAGVRGLARYRPEFDAAL